MGWAVTALVYLLGAVLFFKMARDNRLLRAALWPIFFITAILFS